jgi:hypothetical protein
LRQAYHWLGQDASRIGRGLSADRAVGQALAAFDPSRIPSDDKILPSD